MSDDHDAAAEPGTSRALTEHAARLVELVADWPDLVERVEAVAARHDAAEFHVAVVGEFKRGKSTLVNALLGDTVMPTGVLPVTAIATRVRHGPRGVAVTFHDGHRCNIPIERLADYVTESANPDNRLGVASADVTHPAPLLETGLVLVDTPGTGSAHQHNTEAALRAHRAADAAIVVLAADVALSAADVETLRSFASLPTRPFVILNKADRLAPDAREQVRRFVLDAAQGAVGRAWLTDARAASEQRGDLLEFPQFVQALTAFVRHDLAAARDATTRHGLVSITRDASGRNALRLAGLALDADELTRRSAALAAAIDDQRASFEAELLLAERRCGDLARQLAVDLAGYARDEPSRHIAAIDAAVADAALAGIDEHLRSVVADEVRAGFDTELPALTEALERDWQEVAKRVYDATTTRISQVRASAADLFDASLPELPAPHLDSAPRPFSYLFLPPMVMPLPFENTLRRFVPSSVRRRRAREAAIRALRDEYDRHAGRARSALTAQLHDTLGRHQEQLRDEVERVAASLTCAAERAQADHAAGVDRLRAERQRLSSLAQELAVIEQELSDQPTPSD